ncbi:MAG: hypothetical protein ACKOB5_12135, partial [Betaproteobacteria bacterium]
PIGFLAALYIVEVKGRFASIVRFFVQAMSGVPSIVAGLFIYAVWMIGLGNSYNIMAGAVSERPGYFKGGNAALRPS